MTRSARVARKGNAKNRKSKNRKLSNDTRAQAEDNDENVDPSLQSPSIERKVKATAIPKKGNGRPPLPRKKTTKKKDAKKATNGKKDETIADDISPLKKKKLLGKATAAIAKAPSIQGRPLRRAAAAKKQYADTDSATDEETGSSEDSDYDKKVTSKVIARKVNKRKKNSPSPGKTSSAKKPKMKTPSPQIIRRSEKATSASSSGKRLKALAAAMMTPQGASIGLTPIKDSISKVWKNDGGDWRVQGAIDYQDF